MASDLRRRHRSTRSRRRHRCCLTVCWAPQHHLHLWAVAIMLACCASARNRRGRQRRWWKGDWTSAFHPHGQQCITESWLNVSRTTAPGRARYGRRSNHPFNLRLLEACSPCAASNRRPPYHCLFLQLRQRLVGTTPSYASNKGGPQPLTAPRSCRCRMPSYDDACVRSPLLTLVLWQARCKGNT
jgi:hypothetical protein